MDRDKQIDTFCRYSQVSRETIGSLMKYEELLIKNNKRFNLIGNSTINYIWHRHFLDSFQVIDFFDLNRSSSVLPSGQSMHPLSPFFANQAPLYANGDSHPSLIDTREIQANQRP